MQSTSSTAADWLFMD